MLPKLMLSDNGILYSFAVFTIKSIASISRVVLGKEFSVAVAIFTITNLLFVAIPRLLFLLSAKFPAALHILPYFPLPQEPDSLSPGSEDEKGSAH